MECAQRCQTNRDCRLYAYSKGRNYCWLKSMKGEPIIDADLLTGIKEDSSDCAMQGNTMNKLNLVDVRF